MSYVLQEECRQIYAKEDKKLKIPAVSIVNKYHICANKPKTVTGVCHGDSGGKNRF